MGASPSRVLQDRALIPFAFSEAGAPACEGAKAPHSPGALVCRAVLSPPRRSGALEAAAKRGKPSVPPEEEEDGELPRCSTEQGSKGAAGPGGAAQGTHAGHPRRAPVLPCPPASPRCSASGASARQQAQSLAGLPMPMPGDTGAAPSLTRVMALPSLAPCQRTGAVRTCTTTTCRTPPFPCPVRTITHRC